MKLTNDEVRRRLAALLNFNYKEQQIHITRDIVNNLAMVSYNPIQYTDYMSLPNQAQPPNRYKNLRGVIVALGKTPSEDTVLVNDYQYTPLVVEGELFAFGSYLNVNSIAGKQLTFNLLDTRMYPAYEGTVVRIFKYNGTVYFSTNSRFDATQSRFNGVGETYLNIYLQLGGTPLDELFTNKVNSDAVHVINMVSPSNQNVSFANKYGLYEQKTMPLGPFKGAVTKLPFTLKPEALDFSQANKYLITGSVSESETAHMRGEALLLVDDSNPSDVKTAKILSVDYQWRLRIRGNNSSLLHRYLQLLETRLMEPDVYSLTWPDLVKQYGLDVTSPWGRAVNIFLILQSVLPGKQGEKLSLPEVWGSMDPNQTFAQYVISYDPYVNYDNNYLGVINVLEEFLQQLLIKVDQESINLSNYKTINEVVRNIMSVKYPNSTQPAIEEYKYTLHTMLYRPTVDVSISGTALVKLLSEMKTYKVKQYEQK